MFTRSADITFICLSRKIIKQNSKVIILLKLDMQSDSCLAAFNLSKKANVRTDELLVERPFFFVSMDLVLRFSWKESQKILEIFGYKVQSTVANTTCGRSCCIHFTLV